MSEIKLKPCPFCGGEAKILYNRLRCGHYAHGGTFRVHCKKCGITTEGKKDKLKAIEAWNTRKPMEDVETVLKKISDDYKNSADPYEQGKAFAYNNVIGIVRGE